MLSIQFNLSTLILLIFIFFNIPLSILVLLQNPKSWTNKLFSILIIFLTIYLVVNTELYIFNEYNTRLFFGRFIIANGAILNLLVFLFLYTFPSPGFSLKRKYFLPLLIITLILSLVSFSNLIFEGINISNGNVVTPIPGKLLPLFGLHTLLLIAAGLVAIYKKRKSTTGLDRLRINYIFFGVGILFFLIIVFNFIFPVVLKYGFFVPFLPVYILVFLAIVSFAIMRHKLFDLRVVATQILTLILWIILLANIFTVQDNSQRLINGLILIASIVSGVLLIRSVLKEVQQREKLQELTDKLKLLDAQKDEFISMAAHELRAPMTAVKGYISMILEGDVGDIPDKARGFLADTNAINERMIRLVNNMLNVSRIEEGRMVYQVETENLSRIVRAAYSEFTPEAERKGLDFILDIKPQIKDEVEVDVDRIHEVVTNLISNSIKYTEKGYVRVVLTQPSKAIVRVEVEDTGTGISPEEQERLFKKFYRAESQVGKTIGTGLGLYISKLLIEKFNGKIGVESEEDKGSTFWFELPIKDSSRAN